MDKTEGSLVIESDSQEAVANKIDQYLEYEEKEIGYTPLDGRLPPEPDEAAEQSEEPVEEQEATDEKAKEEQQSPKSLAELAEQTGVSEDALLDLAANAVIDGETKSVTLREALKSYQQESAYTKRSQALANERNTFLQRKEQAETGIRNELIVAEQQVQKLEAEIKAALDSPLLQRLYEDDPQAWAQETVRLKDKAAEAAAFRERIVNNINQYDARRQAEHAERIRELTQREQSMLLEKLPDWHDGTKAAAEWAGISRFVEGRYGFTRDELANILDHRLILVARDAYRYSEAQQATNQLSKKKLAALPKVTVKPGSKQDTRVSDAKADNRKKLQKVLKGSRNLRERERAAAALISDLME